MSLLQRDYFDRSVVKVARDLLGKRLVRIMPDGLTSGRIVETEAYKATGDPACHAARGMTQRNATMFGPPGHAYIYAIHAKYCFNIVTQAEGEPSAVLIRAIEPLDGIELMQERRSREKLVDLTRGPARMCQALALTTDQDAWDLTRGEEIWVEHDEEFDRQAARIGKSSRIGISSATDLQLRFFVRGNPYVSGTKKLNGVAPRK